MLDRIETANSLTEIAGVRLELIKRGTGRPLLLLHPAIGIKSTDRVIEELARSFALIAPSHPGFGRSELPRAMNDHWSRHAGRFFEDFDFAGLDHVEREIDVADGEQGLPVLERHLLAAAFGHFGELLGTESRKGGAGGQFIAHGRSIRREVSRCCGRFQSSKSGLALFNAN